MPGFDGLGVIVIVVVLGSDWQPVNLLVSVMVYVPLCVIFCGADTVFPDASL